MPLRSNAAPMHNNLYNTRQYATVLFGDHEDRDEGTSEGPYKHHGWITKWNYGAFLTCGRVNSTDATRRYRSDSFVMCQHRRFLFCVNFAMSIKFAQDLNK